MPKSTDEICVLLLEDDDADAYLTKRELLSVSRVSKIVRVRNGQEAIAILKAGQVSPDFAFVDLQMPTMDGLEFLERCLAEGLANIPMVVLTSSSTRHDAIRSRVRGALQVIVKPEDPHELRRVLREAIETFSPSTDGQGGAVWSLTSPDEIRVSAAPSAPSVPDAKPFGRRATAVRS